MLVALLTPGMVFVSAVPAQATTSIEVTPAAGTSFQAEGLSPAFTLTTSLDTSNSYTHFTVIEFEPDSSPGQRKWAFNSSDVPDCHVATDPMTFNYATVTSTPSQCGLTFSVSNPRTVADRTVDMGLVKAFVLTQYQQSTLYILLNQPLKSRGSTYTTEFAAGLYTLPDDRQYHSFEVSFKDSFVPADESTWSYAPPHADTTAKPFGGAWFAASYALTTPIASTVSFNANSGSGTMADATGTGSQALPRNTLTKAGHVFDGWATSQIDAQSGIVTYADQADFEHGTDVTLYAVWRVGTAPASTTTPAATTTPARKLATTGTSVSALAPALALGAGWMLIAYSRSLRISRARHLKIERIS
jgi:uncharacterized repeat protein (TIGR02543 family)